MSRKSPFIRRALRAAGVVAVVGGVFGAAPPADADTLPICSITTDNPTVIGTDVVFHARLDCDQPAWVAYQIRLEGPGGVIAQSGGVPTQANAVTNASMARPCAPGKWLGNVNFYTPNATVIPYYFGRAEVMITSC